MLESPSVYEASVARAVFAVTLALIAGFGCLVAGISEYQAWRSTGLVHHPNYLIGAVISPLLLYLGTSGLWRMKTRRIRLELTNKGLVFQHLRGEIWAEWSSLSPFTPLAKSQTVTATVTGPAASPSIVKTGKVVLSASLFGVEVAAFAKQLNQARASGCQFDQDQRR